MTRQSMFNILFIYRFFVKTAKSVRKFAWHFETIKSISISFINLNNMPIDQALFISVRNYNFKGKKLILVLATGIQTIGSQSCHVIWVKSGRKLCGGQSWT